MNIKNLLLNLGLAGALALSAGCAAVVVGAAAAGAGGYAYVAGEMKSTETATLDRVWTATLGAMGDLSFPVITQKKDPGHAELIARTSTDTKISITLNKFSDTATEVRIRVGTFGDKSLSVAILEKIRKRL